MPDETINVGSSRRTSDKEEPLRRIVGRRIKARTGKVWSGTKAVASEPGVWFIAGSVGVSWLFMERAAALDAKTRERLENMRNLGNLEGKLQKVADDPSPVWEFAVCNPERPNQEAVWFFDTDSFDDSSEQEPSMFTATSQ